MRTAKTLIRDLSLRWAHSHFVEFVMSWLTLKILKRGSYGSKVITQDANLPELVFMRLFMNSNGLCNTTHAFYQIF